MVHKNFGIYSEDLSGSDLVIETGADYIACWCKDKTSATVKAFEFFGFSADAATPFANLLAEVQLHSRLLTTHFNNVHCIWGYANGVCIPNEFYSRAAAVAAIELLYGTSVDQKSIIETTLGDCVVSTAINEEAWDAYTKHYRISANMHKYYSLLKTQKPIAEEDKVHIVFYHNNFILSAYKLGQLQIVQRFTYKEPEDALYHILNVCSLHNLDANEIPVKCSGMIDDSSSLYHTLRAYIGNFTFEAPEQAIFGAESFHEYPLHYFAPFCQHDI